MHMHVEAVICVVKTLVYPHATQPVRTYPALASASFSSSWLEHDEAQEEETPVVAQELGERLT